MIKKSAHTTRVIGQLRFQQEPKLGSRQPCFESAKTFWRAKAARVPDLSPKALKP